jgi:hypothetical protein
MVHNGKKHGPYTSLNYPSLVAGHYGWTYTDKNEQQVVVIDGKEYGPYTSAMAPYFNTDGSYMIEIEKKDKQGWLLNGKEFWVWTKAMAATSIYKEIRCYLRAEWQNIYQRKWQRRKKMN